MPCVVKCTARDPDLGGYCYSTHAADGTACGHKMVSHFILITSRLSKELKAYLLALLLQSRKSSMQSRSRVYKL